MNPLCDLSPTAAAMAARVSDAEYARLLLLPRARLADGPLRERAEAARAWYAASGRPVALARVGEIARVSDDGVDLHGGGVLPGAELAGRLRGASATRVTAVLASAGPEVDAASAEAWADDRPDDGFFLERFGVAVAEELLRASVVALCRQAEARGETLLPHLSPGCGGWELEAQGPLWGLLSAGAASLGPVTLHASGQLAPKASLLAVVGVATRTGSAASVSPRDACRGCDLQPCAFRRAPYRGAA
ncbi:MAG: hypothetical protein NDJ94_18125 [Vicinamibacteria bacterium]|nr:hypothetical protein [Vicinamibacteria bacterium]